MAGMLDLLDTDGFPARWNCGAGWQEDPWLGWLHIGSDVAVWFAYLTIPLVLTYFVVHRHNIAFPRIIWLFVAFIAACGTGHLVEAAIFWWPVYRLSAAVKLFTAIVSLATVGGLIAVLPKALELPSLAITANKLSHEVDERRRAESRLGELNEQLTASLRELEQFNQFAVNREERMVELKGEVNALSRKLGQREPYDLSFVEKSSSA
jgi:hypothetical protein